MEPVSVGCSVAEHWPALKLVPRTLYPWSFVGLNGLLLSAQSSVLAAAAVFPLMMEA